MSDQNTTHSPEEELDEDLSFELPKGIRRAITIPAILLIFSILGVYVYLIFSHPETFDPEKYGFPSILIALIVILVAVNIPWSKMGFRIKKIGMIELENVVKTQARGNSKELADLQRQIDELKSTLIPKSSEQDTDKNLDTLVTEFLTKYNQWAFSALRIRKWGAQQNSFENLKNYETQEIRGSLRRLLSKNVVVTRISKNGNTIYKIK